MRTVYINPKLRYNDDSVTSRPEGLELEEYSLTEEQAAHFFPTTNCDTATILYWKKNYCNNLNSLLKPVKLTEQQEPQWHTQDYLVPISDDEILYFKSDGGSYTSIYFADGTVTLQAIGLSKLANHYNHFLRINRGLMVNPTHVECASIKIKQDPAGARAYKMLLTNGTVLPWSRRMYRQLKLNVITYVYKTNLNDLTELTNQFLQQKAV